jgi:flavorubredoxin
MLLFYEKKYKNINPLAVLKALTYYEDINKKEKIKMIIGKYGWQKIEKRLRDMALKKDRLFKNYPV